MAQASLTVPTSSPVIDDAPPSRGRADGHPGRDRAAVVGPLVALAVTLPCCGVTPVSLLRRGRVLGVTLFVITGHGLSIGVPPAVQPLELSRRTGR